MTTKFICVHGHFYQPPRENPWIGEVEIEDSAFPYHDWNERIFQECYGPNAASPLLDSEGRIRRMANNYEDISFNFGPTLLSWLERRHPEAYGRIIEADMTSVRRRGGHGNALAQAYNHAILPLASPRDKRTQVRWGVEDFRARFHREPEGMWLPETAVDDETLEVLLEEGLRFTILSPLQAARVRPIGASQRLWSAPGDALDTRRPYRWFSGAAPGRHIDVFFYDRPVSQAVAFEGLLSSGDDFARRMAASLSGSGPELLTVATDGESYGHHHRFGNMALSYALEELARDASARLTNLGEFLALRPPTDEVAIRPRTAWSCAHGLGRWSSDCGCRVDPSRAWHQRWRGPLRNGLEWLAERIDDFYVEKSKGLLRDPWEARDGYILRMLQPGPAEDQRFLSRHGARHLTRAQARTALRLCELQRQRLLMFTSCGWFFDDVSGLETTQILKYAARAVELAAGLGLEDAAGLEEGFRERLARAPSNDPRVGDGAGVYARLAAPHRVDLSRAAAHFALLDHLRGGEPAPAGGAGEPPPPRGIGPCGPGAFPTHVFDARRPFALRERSGREAGRGRARGAEGERRLTVAHWRLRHRLTLEEFDAAAAVYDRGREDLECRLLPSADADGARELAERLKVAFRAGAEEDFRRSYEALLPEPSYGLDALLVDDRRRTLEARIPRGGPDRWALTSAWLDEIDRLAASPDADPWPALRRLAGAKSAGIAPDALPQAQTLRDRVTGSVRRLLAEPDAGTAARAADLLAAVWETGLHLNVWELQFLYSLWRMKRPATDEDEAARRTLDRLLKFRPLGDRGARILKEPR